MTVKLKLNKRRTYTRRVGKDCIGKFTEWLSKNNLPVPEDGQLKITFSFLNKGKYKKAISSFKKSFV